MKITLFFITFLGIYTSFAQNPVAGSDSLFNPENEQKTFEKMEKDSTKDIERPSVQLYPNPAKNKVEIKIKGFVPGLVQVQLINNFGRTVKLYNRNVFSGSEIIVLMFLEEPGIYFISLKQGSTILKSRLIIH